MRFANEIPIVRIPALALTRNGTPAERLEVRRSCELDRSGGEHEYEITGLRLDVTASVPGLDEAAFSEVAERADRECPISNALRGHVPCTCAPGCRPPPDAARYATGRRCHR